MKRTLILAAAYDRFGCRCSRPRLFHRHDVAYDEYGSIAGVLVGRSRLTLRLRASRVMSEP